MQPRMERVSRPVLGGSERTSATTNPGAVARREEKEACGREVARWWVEAGIQSHSPPQSTVAHHPNTQRERDRGRKIKEKGRQRGGDGTGVETLSSRVSCSSPTMDPGPRPRAFSPHTSLSPSLSLVLRDGLSKICSPRSYARPLRDFGAGGSLFISSTHSLQYHWPGGATLSCTHSKWNQPFPTGHLS